MPDLPTAETQICLQQRPTQTPYTPPFLQADQPTVWWQDDYAGFLPLWNGQHFVFTRVDAYSSYKFVFPWCNDLTKNTIQVLTECLVNHHGITHSIASDEETKFTERCNSSPQSRVLLALPSSSTSWSSCHERKMEQLFEDTTKETIRCHQPGGQDSPGGSLCFELVYGMVS